MQLDANGTNGLGQHRDGASATAGVANFVQAMSGRCGDLLAGHVGDGARRLAENPGVDHDRIATERADPVAHVLDLGALGVKGPYQGDAWSHHGFPHEIFDFAGTPFSTHRTAAPGSGLCGLLFAVSQMGGRVLDIAVVILLWDGAGTVVAHALDQPFRGLDFGRVTDLLASRAGSSVHRDSELNCQVVVIACGVHGLHRLLPVDRAFARRHAVVVGYVDVVQLAGVAGGLERFGPVVLFDVHMEEVEAHAAVAANLVGELERLVVPVDEVGLEPVERLDGDLHADLLGVLLAFLDAVDRPFPFLLDRAHRGGLTTHGTHHASHLPAHLPAPPAPTLPHLTV